MKQVLQNGIWVKGKAKPEGLPEHLRALPAEVVSKDVDDPDRAHDLDAPHIVRSLKKEFDLKQALPSEKKPDAESSLRKLRAPGPGERAPVTQWYVDVAKMRIIASLVDRAIIEFAAGRSPDIETPWHIWFPNKNVNEYSLRKGAPPPKWDRPKHMRKVDLRVDILDPPRSMIDVLKDKGVDLKKEMQDRLQMAKESGNRIILPH